MSNVLPSVGSEIVDERHLQRAVQRQVAADVNLVVLRSGRRAAEFHFQLAGRTKVHVAPEIYAGGAEARSHVGFEKHLACSGDPRSAVGAEKRRRCSLRFTLNSGRSRWYVVPKRDSAAAGNRDALGGRTRSVVDITKHVGNTRYNQMLWMSRS